MALSPGTRLGSYEIVGPLGAGGMGEVYRARDTRLGRDVALKVLPSHLASNADLRARFEREARSVSSLQHPHICVLHDVGHQDGIEYLVMELLEGETLAARLVRGPLPLEQVLKVGAEMANALDKAHKQGIVHRDLKPGNIMLTKSGAKLMDFGLAKPATLSAAAAGSGTAPLLSAARTSEGPSPMSPLTSAGSIVGTVQYMSPEQIEGKPTDARADIFAFGAVLYEMATGKRAFEGKSQLSVASAILEKEPEPISAVQPTSPPALDFVIRTCLAKDPDARFQTAHDVELQLKWIAEGGSQVLPALTPRRRRSRWLMAGAVIAAIVLVALGVWLGQLRTPRLPLVQSQLPLPENVTPNLNADDATGPAMLSPDGSRIAFVGTDDNGLRQIWLRGLEDSSARPLAGTDKATYPFWSPDGKSLGFFADGKLKRISISGGPALEICDASRGRGGSWSSDGNTIIFTPTTNSPIYRVGKDPGSKPTEVTSVDTAIHTTHRWPLFLPDGKHFLYLASNHSAPEANDRNGVYLGSLDDKASRFLVPSDSEPALAAGYLLYLQGGTLMAQRFDVRRLLLKGDPVAVAQAVLLNRGTWRAAFDATENAIVYTSDTGGVNGSTLQWYSDDGAHTGNLSVPDRYFDFRISRDNKKVAAAVGDPMTSIWIVDVEHGTRNRFTFDQNQASNPVWSPDNKYLYFSLRKGVALDIYRKAVMGAAESEPVLQSTSAKHPDDVSPDGKFLLYEDTQLSEPNTLWVLPLSGEGKAHRLLPEPVSTYMGQFSPDGRWIVYSALENGRPQVYVTSFQNGGKWQVTSDAGWVPKWRADGKAIYFLSNEYVSEAPVEVKGDDLQIGTPKRLFKVNTVGGGYWERPVDVTTDGKRFLANSAGPQQSRPISLVLNWTALLQK